MQYLLDTHAFLWFLDGDAQLSPRAMEVISDINNICYVSIASLWEIAIKIRLGKLDTGVPFKKLLSHIDKNDLLLLPLGFDHIVKLLDMEFFHRDPFDRILIAQAQIEGLTIITRDEQFSSYTSKLLW